MYAEVHPYQSYFESFPISSSFSLLFKLLSGRGKKQIACLLEAVSLLAAVVVLLYLAALLR